MGDPTVRKGGHKHKRGPMIQIVGIVPARYHSTRLEGKALADLEGHPMIWWVYSRATQSKQLNRVLVATDDERIAEAVRERGGEVAMTRTDHVSGTDRVAEAARKLDLSEEDVVINVQGDEPLLDPRAIDLLSETMREDDRVDMATLIHPLKSAEEHHNPNVTKVVMDRDGWALYFSRSPIPYQRNEGCSLYRHIGIYGYRFGFLSRLVNEPPTPLERTEALEQLRALEMGHRIKVVETTYVSVGVDTFGDLERVRKTIRERGLSPNS